jgi:tetratricopeptide (TPR) repeat protein
MLRSSSVRERAADSDGQLWAVLHQEESVDSPGLQVIASLASLESLVAAGLHLLELIAVFLGLALVVGLLLGLLRSTWKVTVGRGTLVVPFQGDKGPSVTRILAQQLGSIEREWERMSRLLTESQASTTQTDAPVLIDVGVRSKPDITLDEDHLTLITEDPMQGQALPSLSIGGVSLTPDSLLATGYRIRALLARRTIRGMIDEFGGTVRLSATMMKGGRSPETLVLAEELSSPGRLVSLIDDLCFDIAKIRLGIGSYARTWAGYRTFLEAYLHHLAFLGTGKVSEREAAIEGYGASLAAEPDYDLGHYNMATLLFNRYSSNDNDAALKHFESAAKSPDPDVRALALSGVTLAHCQQVHRFGQPREPSASLAERASVAAMGLNPDLEEVWFARAFAHQVNGRVPDAIAAYTRVVDLPGNSPEEKRMKSFARNNMGWVVMTHDSDVNRAESLFRDALRFYPNKMSHANLGEIYKRRRMYPEALDELRAAVELDPGYVNALNETGMVYVAMAGDRQVGNTSEMTDSLLANAHSWHDRALALVPPDAMLHRAELHRRFSSAYELADFTKEAEREAEEASKLTVDPRSASKKD